MRDNSFIYHFIRIYLTLVLRIFFRSSVKGALPRGGALLCSNHLSNLDPPVLSTLSSKPLHFMAKKELFDKPFLGPLIKKLNAFPVDRAFFDRKAFRRAIKLSAGGSNLVVFPEGTRNKSGTEKIGEIKRGISYLIYNTSAPVIPVFISGTSRWTRLGRIRIRIGEPLSLPERRMPYTREIAESICGKIKDGLEKTASVA